MRQKLIEFVESQRVQAAIIGLIIINAILIGVETSDSLSPQLRSILHIIDQAILAVFVVELLIKLYGYRLGFFKRPWAVFDLVVVSIALMPATGNLSVLRALRIIRIFRLISTVPSMRRVVNGLLASLPGMGSVSALLGLIFYVFAVMATELFGDKFPQWFGTIGESAYSLFQIMTLESWSMGIVRPVMEAFPNSWVFFVPFILVTTFAVLNLFIGIIVDAMNHDTNLKAEAERAELMDTLRKINEKLNLLEQGQSDIKLQQAPGDKD